MPLLGIQLEGVWHTGILCHGIEWFYGGGIQHANPAEVERNFGMTPKKVLDLGETSKSVEEIRAWCESKNALFHESTYDFLKWNCNHFTNELAKFLKGLDDASLGIPEDILHQHEVIARTPRGGTILKMIEAFTNEAKRAGERGGWADFVATGRPAGQASAPVAPAWSMSPDNFEERLRALWEDGSLQPAEKRRALEVLRTIANNIVTHVTEEKYRHIKATSKTIHDHIKPLPHGIAALEALGFWLHEDPEGAAYVFNKPINRDTLQTLHKNVKLLDSLIASAQHTPAGANPAGVHGAGVPSPAAPDYSFQLGKLAELGFVDQEKNVQVLQQTNGNLNQAIDILLQTL